MQCMWNGFCIAVLFFCQWDKLCIHLENTFIKTTWRTVEMESSHLKYEQTSPPLASDIGPDPVPVNRTTIPLGDSTCCCSLEKPKIYILISCFGFHHLETDLIKHPKTSGREPKTKDALTPSKDALTPLLMGNTLGMEVGHLLDERQALGRLTLGKCIFMNFPASKRRVERGVGFRFTKKMPNKWKKHIWFITQQIEEQYLIIYTVICCGWVCSYTKNKGVTIRTVGSLEPTRLVLLLFDVCFRPAPYCVSYIASLLGAVLPFPLLCFGRLASDNIYQKWPCLVKVGGLIWLFH